MTTYEVERADEEIDAVLNAAGAQADEGGTRWPGMTYESGVAAGIGWVLGLNDNNPMED